MSWSSYGAFLGFAVILVLVPGPDFAVVTKNTLTYLLALVTVLHRVRGLLSRQRARRVLNAATGVALLGFSARLATERS